MKIVKDETGNKFGKLLVLRFSHKENKRTYWVCKCECGTEKILSKSRLIGTQSCGCMIYTSSEEKSWLSLLNMYRLNAKKRDYEFNIDIEFFKNMCQKDCVYCGTKPSKIFRNHRK